MAGIEFWILLNEWSDETKKNYIKIGSCNEIETKQTQNRCIRMFALKTVTPIRNSPSICNEELMHFLCDVEWRCQCGFSFSFSLSLFMFSFILACSVSFMCIFIFVVVVASHLFTNTASFSIVLIGILDNIDIMNRYSQNSAFFFVFVFHLSFI